MRGYHLRKKWEVEGSKVRQSFQEPCPFYIWGCYAEKKQISMIRLAPKHQSRKIGRTTGRGSSNGLLVVGIAVGDAKIHAKPCSAKNVAGNEARVRIQGWPRHCLSVGVRNKCHDLKAASPRIQERLCIRKVADLGAGLRNFPT